MSEKDYCFFIDESGWADPAKYKESPYFTIVGVLIRESIREKFKIELDELKLKYFGKKGYVLHGSELRRDLINNKKDIEEFAVDLKKFFNKNHFYLLISSVNQQVAYSMSWVQKTVYVRLYRALLENLIRFLVAKNVRGRIYAEASNISQDIYLYKSFFHFLANGVKKPLIKPEEIKGTLTCLSFVTKKNNDPEEQVADLFGACGKLHNQLKGKEISEDELDAINRVLIEALPKKLLSISDATRPKKVTLYKQIKAFLNFP